MIDDTHGVQKKRALEIVILFRQGQSNAYAVILFCILFRGKGRHAQRRNKQNREKNAEYFFHRLPPFLYSYRIPSDTVQFYPAAEQLSIDRGLRKNEFFLGNC